MTKKEMKAQQVRFDDPTEAQQVVEGRIHSLKVRIGQARRTAQRAETLAQKIEHYGRVADLKEELTTLYRTFWHEVVDLVFGPQEDNAEV